MSRITSNDVVLQENADGILDIVLDDEGDILTDNFLDTSLIRSVFAERRAAKDEVADPQMRRGWIGNEGKDFEDGSKVWLYEQARLNSKTLNGVKSEIENGLLWLLDDRVALDFEVVLGVGDDLEMTAEIKIQRDESRVDNFFFVLFENTGRRG